MTKWYEFGGCLINFSNISCVEMEGKTLVLYAISDKRHVVEFEDEKDMEEAFEELREWLEGDDE